MAGYSRRAVLSGAGASLAALAGCSGDDPPPGLHAVDVLALHRPGDGWYEYPAEAGVQVTVENTDVDTHRGTLVVALRRAEGDEFEWQRERSVRLPGGTTRGYRVVFDVGVAEETDFAAEASIRTA